jgi:glyoxylase-like metal-dependent hydrolase (beta-lactamase superfamily II)
VAPGLWLFPPNRDTRGGSSWYLETASGDVLVDCPAPTQAGLAFLRERRSSRAASLPAWIVLTGRHGHGRCRRWAEPLGWPVVLQEQEAYLLPELSGRQTFGEAHTLATGLRLLWTPGPGPGSCVLHASREAGMGMDLLFCGRLLVPVAPGRLLPIRTRTCFHWPRQLRSLERLRQWLPPHSPGWIASGAGLGALRGEKLVPHAARLLEGLDLQALRGISSAASPL